MMPSHKHKMQNFWNNLALRDSSSTELLTTSTAHYYSHVTLVLPPLYVCHSHAQTCFIDTKLIVQLLYKSFLSYEVVIIGSCAHLMLLGEAMQLP